MEIARSPFSVQRKGMRLSWNRASDDGTLDHFIVADPATLGPGRRGFYREKIDPLAGFSGGGEERNAEKRRMSFFMRVWGAGVSGKVSHEINTNFHEYRENSRVLNW